MSSQLIINDAKRKTSFIRTLKTLLSNASALDMAVSYVQLSGWTLIEQLIANINPSNIRLLITDQFAITHSEALRKAQRLGIEVRYYIGKNVFHPKVYLVYDNARQPTGAIIGSANLSGSGLEFGIEAGIILYDSNTLLELKDWFKQLFGDEYSNVVDKSFLENLEATRKQTTKSRIKVQQIRRENVSNFTSTPTPIPEDIELLEDLISTITLPIGLLNFDHAANNIRNLDRAISALKRYPSIGDKEFSELRLLGMIEIAGSRLTDLGNRARKCSTEKQLAETWCSWVRKQNNSKLQELNPRITSFKRAITNFWKLREEVRTFFFENLHKKAKGVLSKL
jgi:HKD family nuclease